MGLTTVYRHLQRLADEGVIHSVQMPDRQTAYRLCSADRHHHLVCTVCGAAVEFPGDELESWVEGDAERWGYSRVTHNVEIFGTCPACSRTAKGSGRES